MKKNILIVLLLVWSFQTLEAKEERIRFNLKFGFLKGGEAEMVIRDTVFNGKPAFHYYMMGQTTGLAEKLYGVYDIYETTVDAETFLPLKTIRNVKEGNYTRYNETLFYHDVDSIYSQRSGWRKVPPNLVDMISILFYFLHNQPFDSLNPGDGVTYPTLNADKVSDISVQYLREETVETDIGPIKCYVLSPTVAKGKVLKRADGVRFYISKEKKVPVFVTFDMRVGALKAVIKSYEIDGVEQKTR
ncbi:DUF3108 domain-containing protein [Maribellus sp. YY47]|uniref:DUF3108 domain-containing protein n=1 Tax=Maribellus sp. YY47 TaxID=2929486 RepID=UPI002000E076|nr:DUF3108 domain-containing protein [Maribellus sp. YY47]MCK3686205.1 DUF3108 domain-containing protein [Maribellus sp. YY47]